MFAMFIAVLINGLDLNNEGEYIHLHQINNAFEL